LPQVAKATGMVAEGIAAAVGWIDSRPAEAPLGEGVPQSGG